MTLMVSLSSRTPPFTSTVIFFGKVAAGHRGGHLGDVADLAGEVVGHQVHVVGRILPRAADPGHLRLAAQFAFGADLAGDAGHLGGEGVELIDHDVDGVLELENLALHVDGDLLERSPEATAVVTSAMLRTWPVRLSAIRFTLPVAILPGAATLFDPRLAAQFAFGADLARDAGHLRGERVELVDHDVDGVL